MTTICDKEYCLEQQIARHEKELYILTKKHERARKILEKKINKHKEELKDV